MLETEKLRVSLELQRLLSLDERREVSRQLRAIFLSYETEIARLQATITRMEWHFPDDATPLPPVAPITLQEAIERGFIS